MLSRIVGTTMIQINAMTQLSKYEKKIIENRKKNKKTVCIIESIKRSDPRGVLNKILYWKAPPRGTTP